MPRGIHGKIVMPFEPTAPTLSESELDRIVAVALAEDMAQSDITSDILIPANLSGRVIVLIKKRGVLAGGAVAGKAFRQVDPSLRVESLIKDGTPVKSGDIVAAVSGRVSSILKAERVALNLLQRLSGIASLTAQYVRRTRGTNALIVDTRKTTPGLRMLEKYAVWMGGGRNHRFNLSDGILIKDNHIAAMRALGMSLRDMVVKAKKGAPTGIMVEIEVTSLPEAQEALMAGADIIMLDNMGVEEMRRAVELISGKAKIEASGGITLATVRQVALTGVDIISIGALTHSYKSLDISIELEPESLKPA
ncbi:MAG: carboxylating nicotinate-nucleotide diphosphorylase [Dehalococcoidales bacterium]|nr:carboxylating nicotinate-nucleotide diphosphorylase [Dehalococcoidales bacterium]